MMVLRSDQRTKNSTSPQGAIQPILIKVKQRTEEERHHSDEELHDYHNDLTAVRTHISASSPGTEEELREVGIIGHRIPGHGTPRSQTGTSPSSPTVNLTRCCTFRSRTEPDERSKKGYYCFIVGALLTVVGIVMVQVQLDLWTTYERPGVSYICHNLLTAEDRATGDLDEDLKLSPNSVREYVTTLTHRNEDLEEKVKTLEDSRKDIATKLAESNGKNQQFEDRSHELETMNVKLDNELAAEKKENKHLKEQLDKERESAEGSSSDGSRDLSKLRKELADTQKELNTWKSKAEKAVVLAMSPAAANQYFCQKYPVCLENADKLGLYPKSQIGVVILTCKRWNYIKETMTEVFKVRQKSGIPNANTTFPVVVSQDCLPQVEITHGIENEFGKYLGGLIHYDHPNATPAGKTLNGMASGYFKIASHFKFALTKMFSRFHQAIILEDDLRPSIDFFSFFYNTLPILRADPKDLFCVSAWNDNGHASVVSDHLAVHRTEIFPGLGWMATREVVWDELLPRWPQGYWDEFMRRPDVRRGRTCLRPEINRIYHFGKTGGQSKGQFNKYLQTIQINTLNTDWHEGRAHAMLNIVSTKKSYEAWLEHQIKDSTDIPDKETLDKLIIQPGKNYRVMYDKSFVRWAKLFDLMPDTKEGHIRGSYRNVLPFAYKEARFFLVKDWPVIPMTEEPVPVGVVPTKPPPGVTNIVVKQDVNG